MKKLFACGLMVLILSAPCVYAWPQNSEPDKKVLRELRREERRQRKELRKQKRKQKREAKQEQSTPPQEDINDEVFEIPPAKPAPQEPAIDPLPSTKTEQTSKPQLPHEQEKVDVQPTSAPRSYPQSETHISGNSGHSSDTDWSGIFIFALVCAGIIGVLNFIFSGKCRHCGKYRAMVETGETYLGRTKSEWVKDSNGHQHQIHTNRIQIDRQCRYCGYQDRVIKTIKGNN